MTILFNSPSALRTFFSATFVFLFFSASYGQYQAPYKHALGLRVNSSVALSYKHFFNKKGHAVEVIAKTRGYSGSYRSYTARVGYLIHKDMAPVLEWINLDPIENFSYYFGGGIGSRVAVYGNEFDTDVSFGLQGYFGMEYKVPNIPLAVGLDLVPNVYFSNGSLGRSHFPTANLIARYVFK